MTETVKWGMIGCGDVAEVKSGPAFQKCDNSQLLAVMRRDANLAKDFAQRHQVSLWYDKAQDLLDNPKINSVYIATPPSYHLQYAIQALKAGKDVYLEKPMVLSKKEAQELSAVVQESDQKLVVAHYRRFLPLYSKVKELLECNLLGDIKYVDIRFLQPHNFHSKANWRLDKALSGGGYFHDIAPHQIDLMYYFFGDYAQATGLAVNQSRRYNVPDTVNGLISFQNNIQFRGIWSFTCPEHLKEDNCNVYGEKGTLSFSFYEETLHVKTNTENKKYNFSNPEHIQQPFIQETVNYFLGKRNNPCSVLDGTVVTTIMDELTKTNNNHGANMEMVRA